LAVHRALFVLFALTLATAAPAADARAPQDDQVASHRLGYSGATLTIRETFPDGWSIARRTFILKGADGRTRTLPLRPGGGAAANQSLNLFRRDQDSYLLLSDRDCLVFDPIKVTTSSCPARPPCENGHARAGTYLGRFDWMNAFDPPHGAFRLAWRYLPAEDAAEDTCRR
jgi:hypothetical protein